MTLSILVMNSRNNDSRRLIFDRLPVSIGRHEYNRLQLCDPGVSRFHVVIEWNDEKIVLCDLGSTNGTFHEGLPLRPCEPITVDDEEFAIAVGPFHLAVARHLPSTLPGMQDLDATRIVERNELSWLRRADDAGTVVYGKFRR